MIQNMSAENIFDYMDILLNKYALSAEDFSIQFNLTDTGEQIVIQCVNGVILQYHDMSSDEAELSVTTTKNALFYLIQRDMDSFTKAAQMEGDSTVLTDLVENLTEERTKQFNIIEP